MARDAYWRRVRPVRVIDGDTLDLVVDLGYHVSAEHRVRLLGLDTPEVRGPSAEAGRAVTAWVRAWLAAHGAHAGAHPSWPFALRSEKSDSFGRFLGVLECSEGHVLNGDLLADGLAVVDVR